MKRKTLLVFIVAICLTSSIALADTLQTSGVWTAVPTPDGKSPIFPFWDSPSLDGVKENVGYILTGTNKFISGYTTKDWLGFANGTAQYLSAASPTGGVVNDVYFTNNLGGQSAYLIIEIAGYKDQNIFGVYDRSDPNHKTVIFNGAAGKGANWPGSLSVQIPYSSYGFYLTTPEHNTFYSDTTNVTNPDKNSNFAFFRNTSQANTFYIGMEDLKDPIGTENLGDYNDMIVKVQVAAAPIPSTLLLLGSGLVGLALLGWKKKTS